MSMVVAAVVDKCEAEEKETEEEEEEAMPLWMLMLRY